MFSIVSCTLRILCVICFVKSILADESNEGPCPNITGAKDFSINMMLGHWYGIQHRNFEDHRCLQAFAQSAVERNLTLYFTYSDVSGAEVRLNVTAISYPNDSATVDAYLINKDETLSWETWVYFYADSNRCFGVAKCHDTSGSEGYDGKHHHKVTIVIMCRSFHPSDEDLQPVYDEMRKQGLNKYMLKDYNHENCSN